jgi:hypothetical protein
MDSFDSSHPNYCTFLYLIYYSPLLYSQYGYQVLSVCTVEKMQSGSAFEGFLVPIVSSEEILLDVLGWNTTPQWSYFVACERGLTLYHCVSYCLTPVQYVAGADAGIEKVCHNRVEALALARIFSFSGLGSKASIAFRCPR